jgi:ribosome-binding factor A
MSFQTLKTPKKKTRTLRALCADVGPDDGLDPRELLKQKQGAGRSSARSHHDRKAKQLGRQVAETLEAVFAGDSRDDVLRGLRVVSVTPAPDSSRLLVTVAPLPPFDGLDPADLLDRLARASGRLRSEVASAITRKHAPVLTYRLALPVDAL